MICHHSISRAVIQKGETQAPLDEGLLDLQLYIDKCMISVIFNATVQHGAYAYHIVLAKIVQIGFLTWQSEDLHILSVFFIQIYLSCPV